MKPKVGELAPDFTAEVVGGEHGVGGELTLSSLRGGKVLLFFYPRDLTPGCTTQACALRDAWDELAERVTVLGVSTDDAASHRKFIDKKELPFALVADPEKRIVESYGVWVEKSMYGKKFMGTERSSFLIDEEGRVEAVLEKVSPKKHLALVEELLGQA